ncbi:hypothetical protein CVT24_000796 [Panaeolus cyanescens]|uniref:Uncharacterized protein n=1 Tax=Panaeolus cyanescens TaxID=181874 RepID=A0A409YTF7_9AGAR|nr:hypothetical protein CVT24_000796 [Panaeolus cyanescens]
MIAFIMLLPRNSQMLFLIPIFSPFSNHSGRIMAPVLQPLRPGPRRNCSPSNTLKKSHITLSVLPTSKFSRPPPRALST